MASIFISYRRDDAGGHAGRLCDRLTTRFGDDRVFMDIQDIRPGQDFGQSIDETIAGCDYVLAVIGPRWIESIRARGGSEDFVRHEVAAALRRNVTLIPVLVGAARMPAGHLLPAELAPLCRRNAVEVRDEHFDDDVARLASFLETSLGASPRPHQTRPGSRRTIIAAAVVGLVAIAAVVAVLIGRDRSPQPSADSAADSASNGATPVAAAAATPTTPTPTAPTPASAASGAVSPAAPQLAGAWIAEMQKPGRRPYRIRLDFVGSRGSYAGTVRYPTGDGILEDVRLDGSALSFKTVHVPQFESEPATITYRGEFGADEIQLTAIDSNGVAAGVARRAPGRRGGAAPRARRGGQEGEGGR